jgi:hypothetical protein
VNALPTAVHPPAARKLVGTGLVQMPWTNRNAAPGQRIVAWSAGRRPRRPGARRLPRWRERATLPLGFILSPSATLRVAGLAPRVKVEHPTV